MIILGIDPGYSRTGYAILDADKKRKPCLRASGVIETPATDDFPARLLQLCTEFRAIINEHKPDDMALEELFWSKNAKTAIGVAQARGALIATAAELGLNVAEYSPTTLKLGLTGSGAAAKGQVRFMVEKILDIAPGSKRLDDEFDALALALLHTMQKGLML